MKKLLLFYSMAALLLTACKKDDPQEDISDLIDYPATAVVIRDAVTDIDGNKYDAVRIGEQELREDLNKRLRN